MNYGYKFIISIKRLKDNMIDGCNFKIFFIIKKYQKTHLELIVSFSYHNLH